MSQSWPTQLLDLLERVDAEEAPHGLYGIRRAYTPEGPLPSAAHVLGGPSMVNLFRRCGFSGGTSGRHSQVVSFTTGGETVWLQILDYATTKVRHFGSAFRLDKHHTKQSSEPRWDLETLVPKLTRQSRLYETQSLLLIAHFVSDSDLKKVLGKTVDPAFLDRYGLACHVRMWDDRYARGFRTALHLWVPQIFDAESEPAPNDDERV
jgi:hypothetical protein